MKIKLIVDDSGKQTLFQFTKALVGNVAGGQQVVKLEITDDLAFVLTTQPAVVKQMVEGR